jgi:hypothetical protein
MRQDPTGRVEPRQGVKGSLSARAWNRMIEASNAVMAERGGIRGSTEVSRESSLMIPMKIAGTAAYNPENPTGVFPPCTVVLLDSFAAAPTAYRSEGTKGVALEPENGVYKGTYAMPCGIANVSFLNWTQSDAPLPPWGVTVEGGKLGDIVRVIVRGIAPVRIRVMSYGYEPTKHVFAQPAMRRTQAESVAKIAGVAETTLCDCGNTAKILHIDGQTSYSASGGSENAATHWGIVIL